MIWFNISNLFGPLDSLIRFNISNFSVPSRPGGFGIGGTSNTSALPPGADDTARKDALDSLQKVHEELEVIACM